ncbi:MAG: hypothetical protein LQ343_000976 [Gyalolechia ehrenbergii]|nr:MAG: hypothetical protein LQ343_000976 [Gyalolechia ehrenbergii]
MADQIDLSNEADLSENSSDDAVVDELNSSAPPPPSDTGPFPWSWPDAHFFTGRREYWKAVEIVCRGALFIPVGEYRDNVNDMTPAFVQ